ncbi:ABC transporter ATP-binding protein [Conexibacter sp. JD483]|uniref:ABC transporter ATP-binding protein n=1 Tax=unclassified Conexibacter TaxID=2627773 RepID=UPI002720FE2E|nr:MULTISPECIES: ABC transporter ATP-binding protein [unclassified Conexibacter]MDO8185487.1 ABC transporter ATP-binding protein [Conexibacter sp. CPCC 205706]MDO8197326.1 ABC transporter ATP-binding protein [Conexibacter sp. CPCC 205762]MDR9371090.1 ABC transporter ATP-binding protein [Conexibacter sp. JD483]
MQDASVNPLVRLWRRAPRYRGQVVRGTVWAVLNQIFDILPELLIGVAIDVVVRQEGSFVGQWTGIVDREQQLFVLAGVTAVVWLLESLTEYLAQRAWRTLSQDLQHDLRMEAYGHVQELELAWFEDRESGRLLTILNDDVNQLERFLDVGALQIIQTATSVVGVGVVFFVISPLLAVLAFLPIPVIIGGSLLFQRRLEPRYARVREEAGRLGGLIGGNLGGIATIKAFGAERREAQRVSAASLSYAAANREAITLSAAFVPVIRVAILCGFMVTLVVGGHLTLNGTLEIGMYSVLVFMTQRLLWPLTALGETLDLYQRGTASLRRILDLIDAPVAISPGERELPPAAAGSRGRAVRFDDVRFVYRDGDGEIRTHVLDGLELDVAAGETHAIVGPTGAGKSTVVKLLLRLYDAESGTVSIDGEPVEGLAFEQLRGAIGYVGQDTFLFDGSIADNLRYGSPDATDAQLRAAAELAEAHEFVAALPHGYDTPVGERGVRLSGGQRQRLTIARALVRDPAILVLDEATSAVDNETEAAIQRSLLRVSRERTTIVIAHRLSTIRHADRIHVLDGGRVAEAGTHDELLRERGRYAALWAVQTGEIAQASAGDG